VASQVYIARFAESESEESICAKTQKVFRAAGLGTVIVGDQIAAVKTHFGERGNDSFIPPAVVKTVVDEVRDAGAEPCLVETATLYRGQRSNAVDHFNLAVEHGFGPEAMGCPLVFLDGLRGNLHVEQKVGLKHFDTVAVAGDFTLIPSAVIVSHVTGHILAGFGGAIKNVAMGLASRAGKLRQHSEGRPRVDDASCVACGTCAQWCPADAITVDESAVIDYGLCIGCGECVAVCPVGAVGFSWDSTPHSFNEKLAEYAYGILKDKLGNVGFVNVIRHTTADCNCMGKKDDSLCRDVGVLASRDAVAIDQASADLVEEAYGSDLFEELKPDAHYQAQFRHGEAIGLGNRAYELIEV